MYMIEGDFAYGPLLLQFTLFLCGLKLLKRDISSQMYSDDM